MPRGSDGSYSLPAGTLVNAGDTILPSQHNPAMSDIGTALGGSLSRDGLGGMRAPLNMGGFAISNIAPGISQTDVATVAQARQAGLPVGTMLDFAGTIVPDGYLLCFGQAVSRTDYPDLFAVLGTVWGPGNGSTTFNLPDLRGRVSAGKDDMGGTAAARLNSSVIGSTLGATGGAQSHTLTSGEMPVHNHTLTDPGHSHSYTLVTPTGGIGVGSGFGQINANTTSSTTGITIANAGGGAAHNNVQPTAVVNKIIKAIL